MITVDTLGDAEKDWVWRCCQCALAWVDGAWQRLDNRQWIPLDELPPGPFFRIDNPNFGDYRNGLPFHLRFDPDPRFITPEGSK